MSNDAHASTPGETEEVLAGGNMGEVVRVGVTVRRPAGEWTPAVQRLLEVLGDAGVSGIPRPLGLDERGREVLSFVEGDNLAAADPELLWSDRVLIGAGELLRRLHDASVPLVDAGLLWRSTAREPVEVICHNDFATYNLIVRDGELVGAIDFDLAWPFAGGWGSGTDLGRSVSTPPGHLHAAAVRVQSERRFDRRQAPFELRRRLALDETVAPEANSPRRRG